MKKQENYTIRHIIQVNRELILADLCSKVTCDYCGRTVIKNNILIHERSDICKRHRQRKLEKEQFKQLNETTTN